MSPCDFELTLTVEKAEDNVKVEIEVDGSEGYYRNSEVPFKGEKSPRVQKIIYRAVPTGEYEVKATLFKHDLKTYEADVAIQRISIR